MSKIALNGFDRQIEYIDLILAKGKTLNIDSLLQVSQDYCAVEAFSFTTYIFFFTEYFEPRVKVYTASLGDGSIKLVNDEELIHTLE